MGLVFLSNHRAYDHRIKKLIAETKNPDLFPDLAIPLSTAKTWIRKGVRDVVTVAGFDADKNALPPQIAVLRRELSQGGAKSELIRRQPLIHPTHFSIASLRS